MGRWFLVWLLAGLGACSLAPPQPAVSRHADAPAALAEFRLQGRVAVRNGEQQFSGGLNWRRAAGRDVLLLSTPLGQGVAEVRRQPDGVELIDAEGRRHQAADAESLLRRVTGMQLPIEGLSAWVSGAPRAGTAFSAAKDEQGRLGSLEQDGWHIEFSRYVQALGRWLPGRLVARRDADLEVKLVVDGWESP
jgi:outer membrane lipoprotein LolB